MRTSVLDDSDPGYERKKTRSLERHVRSARHPSQEPSQPYLSFTQGRHIRLMTMAAKRTRIKTVVTNGAKSKGGRRGQCKCLASQALQVLRAIQAVRGGVRGPTCRQGSCGVALDPPRSLPRRGGRSRLQDQISVGTVQPLLSRPRAIHSLCGGQVLHLETLFSPWRNQRPQLSTFRIIFSLTKQTTEW